MNIRCAPASAPALQSRLPQSPSNGAPLLRCLLPPERDMSEMIGRSLGHYRITAAIGAGGMGEVFRATDTKLGRAIALKVPSRYGSRRRSPGAIPA